MQPSSKSGIQSLGRSRLAWRVGPAILLLAAGMISIDFLVAVYGKYHQLDPAAYTMFWTRRGWLWTHLAGGALVIILGPVQLLTQWPRAYPHLHRWTGRMYMTNMFIACVGAAGLIATSPAPFAIRGAFAATALAWLTTALTGLIAIHGGRVSSHRRGPYRLARRGAPRRRSHGHWPGALHSERHLSWHGVFTAAGPAWPAVGCRSRAWAVRGVLPQV